MQRLILLPLAGHVSLLPPGSDHNAARDVLSRLLADATGPETANLFAATATEADGIAFLAPPGRVARFADLDSVGREALRAEIGRLVSALRRAAEVAARRDPAAAGLSALVAAAIEVPSFETVFAHEGRPILAGWGLAPAGQRAGQRLLARLDDGVPVPPPPPRAPWAAVGLGAALLALLAAGTVAAAPWITRWIGPKPALCRAEPGSLDAMLGLLREQEREQDLRRRLAALQTDLGHRRLACPLPATLPSPEPPPPEPPRPEPRPEPPPPEPPLPPPPEPSPPPPPEPRPEPRPAPRPPPEARPQPPPNTQPCNQETRSGGQGRTRTQHFLGPQPGRVQLQYDTRIDPDEIRVRYRGRTVAETGGRVSGPGFIEFNWNPPQGSSPEEQVVEVEVVGPGQGTVWGYNLGCPGGGRR